MPERTANSVSEAIVPYAGKPSSNVQDILNNYVAKSSLKMYDRSNIRLILYLFDIDPEMFLHSSFLDDALEADDLDFALGWKEKGRRDNLRDLCKKRLEIVNKHDKNCPLILQKVTFNVFSHYLATKRNKKGEMMSKSSYGMFRSAFTHLHKMAGQAIPLQFQQDMATFNRGIKRKVTQEKMEAGLSLEEGKKAMNFDVYKLMCGKMLTMNSDEGSFAHLFLVLEWNLMARASNCMNFRLGHLEWRHDCLVFFFGKSKRDQTGENSDSPWHVYSNSCEPSICPVLTLARYLFSFPDIATSNTALFPGNDQYSR